MVSKSKRLQSECVNMLMICLCKKLHKCNSNNSQVITIKLTAKFRFHATVSFYTRVKNLTNIWVCCLHSTINYFDESFISFKDVLLWIISVQWIKWHHMTSSPQICACAMLSLLRVGSFVLSIFSSSLLSEDIKIEIYKSVILPVVLYECETLSLTWRKNIDWRHFRTRSCGKFYPKERK